MYQQPYFSKQDEDSLFQFMESHPFVFLVVADGMHIQATHIPVEVQKVDGEIIISGHLMSNTPHHLAMEKNPNVTAIFSGPHCFVNASWYTEPKQASTWNYMDVHAQGKIQFTDRAGTLELIKRITDQYVGLDAPASFQQLDENYIDHSLQYIIGFHICVTSVKHTFKLSQNKNQQTRENIIRQLMATSDADSQKIAEEMQKRLK